MKLKFTQVLFATIILFITGREMAFAQSENLVVIDQGFAQKEKLLAKLPPNVSILNLNGASNPWKAIREKLKKDTKLKNIHLFAEANYNSIQIGGINYNLKTVNTENEFGMLEGLYDGTHLQLLIYNCNLGTNNEGIKLIKAISEKAYLNIGVCTNCTSIFDSDFNFGYTTLNQLISIKPFTLN